MPTRITNAPTTELSAAVVAILLSGWQAMPAEGESPSKGVFALGGGWGAAAAQEGDAVFDLMEGGDAGVVRLWQRHEAHLRAEARRLGITPSTWRVKGRAVFFGEYMMAPWQDQDTDG